VSFDATEKPAAEDFDILLEDSEREYALTLADGTSTWAFWSFLGLLIPTYTIFRL